MVDDCNATSPRATSECELSSGWYGLDLGCNSSQPRPPEPGAVHTSLGSQREYRRLFFDCNLHLVLPQLLGQKCLSDANSTSQRSQDALLVTQGSTKHELTDSEVARLLRQHLNILVASQSASDAEVIAAAKVLQQQFQPRMEFSCQEREAELEEAAEGKVADPGARRRVPLSQDSCDAGDPADAALEEVTRSWLGCSSEDASQVADKVASPDRGGRPHTAAMHPSNDMGRNVTGLQTSHAQEFQAHGAVRNVVPVEASARSEGALRRYATDFSGTIMSHDQPAKKMCVEIHDAN